MSSEELKKTDERIKQLEDYIILMESLYYKLLRLASDLVSAIQHVGARRDIYSAPLGESPFDRIHVPSPIEPIFLKCNSCGTFYNYLKFKCPKCSK